MLKSVHDYRKQVLGIRFNGEPQKTLEKSHPISVAFYADSNDFELQKPMVDKILGLFHDRPTLISHDSYEPYEVETLFTFGEPTTDNVEAKNCFSFQSLSSISQSPDLKRELWKKLKKYT